MEVFCLAKDSFQRILECKKILGNSAEFLESVVIIIQSKISNHNISFWLEKAKYHLPLSHLLQNTNLTTFGIEIGCCQVVLFRRQSRLVHVRKRAELFL